jgi:hypothetical protein
VGLRAVRHGYYTRVRKKSGGVPRVTARNRPGETPCGHRSVTTGKNDNPGVGDPPEDSLHSSHRVYWIRFRFYIIQHTPPVEEDRATVKEVPDSKPSQVALGESAARCPPGWHRVARRALRP